MTSNNFPKTAVEWTEKLVSFDTTSRNSNLPLVKYLASYFDSVGVKYDILKDPTGEKANIFATIEPLPDSKAKGGIVLSGHLDVVPVDGQKWDTDPFKTVIKDGKMYGRGTCDMKGFIAVCLSLVPEFLRMSRTRPIYFALSRDEEIGCLGGRELTQMMKSRGIKVDGVVVGEPTSNKVVVAHKGMCVWKVTVTGLAKHSSFALTKGSCNAIDYASRLIVAIRDIAEDMQATGMRDNFFDVPFSTMSTNLIRGGNAMNTVPAECQFQYEFRNIATVSQDAIQRRVADHVEKVLLPKMRQEYSEANIVIDSVAGVPAMNDADEQDPFTVLVRTLASDKEKRKLAGATEAGQFALIGAPVVICGPGSLGVAHQPQEFVPIAEIEECVKMVRALIAKNQSGSHL